MKRYILLLSSFILLKFAAAQTLAGHLWESRPILLFTPSPAGTAYRQQLDILTKAGGEVTDRSLVIYTICPKGGKKPDGGTLSAIQADALYSKYGITPGQGFTFLLIGKDGTEKLRKKEPVSTRELFSLIDSMPMRKAEMRRKEKNKGHKK